MSIRINGIGLLTAHLAKTKTRLATLKSVSEADAKARQLGVKIPVWTLRSLIRLAGDFAGIRPLRNDAKFFAEITVKTTAEKLWCPGRNRTRAFMRFVSIAKGVWFEDAE